MNEPTISAFYAAEPLAGRRALHAAAANHRTVKDAETGALVILRHAEVQGLLLEPKLSGVGLTFFDHMGIKDGPLRAWYGALMFTNEGRPHHRLRSLVGKAFSPRAVEHLRPAAATIIGERLSRLRDDKGGDLIQALSDVPMRVMCRLLGVPDEDVPSFITWVDALGPIFGMMTPEQIEAATAAIVKLLGYVRALHDRRETTPGDDLISALIAAEHEGDRLTSQETVAMVTNLLVAGHDTTSSQIGCTLLTLLERPEVLADVRAGRANLSDVVNECIRFEPGIGFAPRTVVSPIEIAGQERAAGSMVWLSTMTANRDPDVWPEPEKFDPGRFADANGPKLLSFGGGPHHCLGAWLARLTLEETVRAVAALGPSLELASNDIPWVMKLGANPGSLPVSIH